MANTSFMRLIKLIFKRATSHSKISRLVSIVKQNDLT